jgi:hypothetical protein
MKTQQIYLSNKYTNANVTATNGQVTRTESIDLINNELFADAGSTEDIKELYEGFWGGQIQVTNIELTN